jgi:hypothetical protein
LLLGKYLLPVFLALFDLFLQFRQILFGDVLVDDLLPVPPYKVMVDVFFALALFLADIEGALGVVFRLGVKGLNDLLAPPVFIFQRPGANPSRPRRKTQKAYPAVDVLSELRRMEAWASANPVNRKSN